jgi:hypothetical protein
MQCEVVHGAGRVNRFQGENADMDSPTQPITTPEMNQPASNGLGSALALALAEQARRGTLALAIAAGRGAPPPQVLAQIAHADHVHAELLACGREVRFLEGLDGRHTIELCGGEGETLTTLSLTEAIELACGRPGV